MSKVCFIIKSFNKKRIVKNIIEIEKNIEYNVNCFVACKSFFDWNWLNSVNNSKGFLDWLSKILFVDVLLFHAF